MLLLSLRRSDALDKEASTKRIQSLASSLVEELVDRRVPFLVLFEHLWNNGKVPVSMQFTGGDDTAEIGTFAIANSKSS
jgi:hypothetical protein